MRRCTDSAGGIITPSRLETTPNCDDTLSTTTLGKTVDFNGQWLFFGCYINHTTSHLYILMMTTVLQTVASHEKSIAGDAIGIHYKKQFVPMNCVY